MKKLTHWLCRRCKELKELGEEIARADAGAICKACQAGSTPATPPEAAAQEQVVTVHRRGLQRRHGEDRRDD